MKVAVILPAAGLGTRMGRTSPEKAGTSRKQFMLLEGAPILLHSVRKFAASARVDEIVVAVRREDLDWVSELLQREVRGKRVRVVEGGNSRQQSGAESLLHFGELVREVADNAIPILIDDIDRTGRHSSGRGDHQEDRVCR